MNKEELKNISQKYADSQGFLLQPDEKILDGILTGLLKREEKFGFRYCPCRIVTRDKEKDKKIICPCIYHKDEIKNDGHCKCRLFLRK
jgi:ferredoxin-thioredoxin reductase catalytic subunit